MDLSEILHNNRHTKTKEGIPVLTEETRTAFSKSLEVEVEIRECPDSILVEWVDEIGEENPEVIEYASGIVGRFPPKLKGIALASLLSLYELLKSRALNDKIKKYFGIQDKNYHT